MDAGRKRNHPCSQGIRGARWGGKGEGREVWKSKVAWIPWLPLWDWNKQNKNKACHSWEAMTRIQELGPSGIWKEFKSEYSLYFISSYSAKAFHLKKTGVIRWSKIVTALGYFFPNETFQSLISVTEYILTIRSYFLVFTCLANMSALEIKHVKIAKCDKLYVRRLFKNTKLHWTRNSCSIVYLPNLIPYHLSLYQITPNMTQRQFV